MASDEGLPEQSNELSQPAAVRSSRRTRRRDYDGPQPLEDPALETVAQFLSTPKDILEIKTLTDLANNLAVSRMTVYRWSRHPDVLERARHLLEHNKLKADLDIRLYWDRIVRGQIRKAMKGDTKAADFCEKRAWPKLDPFSLK